MYVEKGLYRSNDVQWYEGWPFQKIEVVDCKDGVVSFTTEWPVRELDCLLEDFKERFRKW
jgi:hypothetical protein